tara:strand:- start:1268 stop:1489 length:222 start_codon:yes stop_codon:yes gene_type:complete
MLTIVGFRDAVRPQSLSLVDGMCHGHNVIRWRGNELVDEIYDSGQFLDGFGELVIGKMEPRQHRNMLYLIFIE